MEMSILDKNIKVYKNRKLNLFLSQFAYEPSSKKKLLWDAIKKINLPQKGLKILDIGFGNGLNIFSFKKNNEVFGIEITQNMVDFANRIAKKKKFKNYCFKLYNGFGYIPFDSDFFDIVICSHVLEHVPDDEFMIKEIYRVLKKQGISFIVVPVNEDNEKDVHARKYTIIDFCKILILNGFKIIYQIEADKLSGRVKSKLEFTSRNLFSACGWIMFNTLLSVLPYRVLKKIENIYFEKYHFTQYLVAVTK